MRRFLILLSLVPVLASAIGFESKTWMYKNCRIHIAIGKRESGAIGTYLVTVSASSGKRATVRADRDGALINAWSADIDRDGKFEVIVATRSAAGGNYGKVGVFAWSGSDLKKIIVPELNPIQVKGYMGQDQFTVTRNTLYRTFPTFLQKGNDPAKKTGMRTLWLNVKKFRWEKV